MNNMRLLLTVNIVLSLGHGLAFILAPALALGFYQIPVAPGALLMGQLFGAELLVVAIMCWYGRSFTGVPALTALVIAGLVPNLVGAIACVRATMAGVMGTMGWLAVVVYGGLALAYVVQYLRKAHLHSAG